MAYSEETVSVMHQMQSQFLWLKRGMKVDKDKSRMDKDWNDARKFVGYSLANNLIQACKNGSCDRIPSFYVPYLSAISIEEFKEMKAYFIWKDKYDGCDADDDLKKRIYLEACDEIRRCKVNCLNKTENMPEELIVLLVDQHTSAQPDLLERRAFWNSVRGNNPDAFHNWRVAEEFNALLFGDLLSSTPISTECINNYFERTEEAPHLTTMFEYSIRCPLLKNSGISKKIPENVCWK